MKVIKDASYKSVILLQISYIFKINFDTQDDEDY